ncbi:MAG: FKBP-type peptidyl-prolyl cis-trans isomerase [Gemmatimonadetes bacterium]|nr:FKBP-type peptidyl-prolyl cis-trans isomerase [Gemmatimonadota bacterium]
MPETNVTNRMWLAAAALALAATACGGDGAEKAQPAEEQAPALPRDAVTIETYADSLNVDLAKMQRTETGLYVLDIKEGEGAPVQAGQTVTMEYTGWLPNGRRFDTSEGKQPYVFTVGRGEAIKGWDQGVLGMKAGGQRRLIVPPRLAYGDEGFGGYIPPSAVLVFDLVLVSAK